MCKNPEIQRLLADPAVMEVLLMMKLSGHYEGQAQRLENVFITLTAGGVQSIVMRMFVCLSFMASLHEIFMHVNSGHVIARFSSDGVAKR